MIIDGQGVTFDDPANVTAAEVAEAINAQVEGVVASHDPRRNVVEITPV